jgi:uncharacterized glyoxalase superfamily protein PhnB
LIVDSAAAAIDFYVRAFGAQEDYRLVSPQGRVEHAEIKLGPVTLMLAEEFPDLGCVSPKRHEGTSITLALTVEDVDSFVQRAVDAGATLERPVQDQFYGQRVGRLRDPFGHRWSIHTEREGLTSAEIQRRYAELTGR